MRIRRFREAGLSLKEISSVLATGGTPGTRLLEQRMRQTAEDIVGLKNQQRLLAGMFRKVASGKRPQCVNKEMWIEMLKAAGWINARWTDGIANSSAVRQRGTRNFCFPLAFLPMKQRGYARSAGAEAET